MTFSESLLTVAVQADRSPFGAVVVSEGIFASENPFRFSTKFQDEESDLIVYQARPYDPNLQRFTCRDPLGEVGGVNAYTFCLNDSVSRFDPNGLISAGTWEEIASAIIGVVAGSVLWDQYSDQAIIDMYGGDETFMKATRAELSRKGGPFSVQLWDHAAKPDSSSVRIFPKNQSEWSQAVDLVQKAPEFKEKSDYVKTRLKEGTTFRGHLHIEFEATSDLAYSIHGAQLWYEYQPNKCLLLFWVSDEYNFDKKHMWRYLQEKGKLDKFNVGVRLPDEQFSIKQ